MLPGLVLGAIALATVGTACAQDSAEAPTAPLAAASQPTQVLAPPPTAVPPPPDPTPEPTRTSVPAVSATALFATVVESLIAAGSLHFEMEMEATLPVQGIALKVPLVFIGDYLMPDSFAGAVALDLPFFRVSKQIVSVGDKIYMADVGGDEWEVVSSETPFFASPIPFLEVDSIDVNSAVVAGIETLGTQAYYRLDAAKATGSLASNIGDFELSYLIGVDDGLVAQIKAEGELDLGDDPFIGGSFQGNIPISMTLTLSDFGQEVSIEAPVP